MYMKTDLLFHLTTHSITYIKKNPNLTNVFEESDYCLHMLLKLILKLVNSIGYDCFKTLEISLFIILRKFSIYNLQMSRLFYSRFEENTAVICTLYV
jgi:hypothetical protein